MTLLNRKMYRMCFRILSELSVQKVLDVEFGSGYILKMLKKNSLFMVLTSLVLL